MLTAVNMIGTKQTILHAACDIYLLEGYKGMSMRKVAEKAAISATAIYRHFENKEALHHQVLREGFRTFDSYLQPALLGKTGMERLDLAARRFFAFATEQRKYHEILFLTMDHTVEHKVKGVLGKDATVSQKFMVERIQECMAEGSLRRDDPELDAIAERGKQHEQRYLERLQAAGRTIVDLDDEHTLVELQRRDVLGHLLAADDQGLRHHGI